MEEEYQLPITFLKHTPYHFFLHPTVTATDTFGIHLPQRPLQSLLLALQADRLVTNRLGIPREHAHTYKR